ncbi:MAG: hypothetical protein ACLP0B_09850 [Steroidobacteraceae bacterium]|jgi:hypothetical protein
MDTDEHTDSLAAIRARIIEIERELFAPDNYTRSNVTSPNCAELDRVRAIHFAVLGRERSELLAKLPPTGMASGERIVFSKVLGDIRDWPEPEAIDDGYDPSDPYARYEREAGIFRDE